MPKSFVVMTAMPPTKGHLDLIKYAYLLTGDVTVIVCTQPGEPFSEARRDAIHDACIRANIPAKVYQFNKTIQQEPRWEDDFAFWNMWSGILDSYHFSFGDYIVASETYGKELADAVGGVFMPYDINRVSNLAKASYVRKNPVGYQDYILPEFMPYLRRTVTIFGAESVGKTTSSLLLGYHLRATVLDEWARPYLETVGPEVTREKMYRIMEGQAVLQDMGLQQTESIYTIQDTDLFSTLGFWEMWNKDTVPAQLRNEAQNRKSDLYVILSSDIPFEADPLRYGGDRRETEDQYWIDLCEREGLPYVYITATMNRELDVLHAIESYFKNPLSYQRSGQEYEKSV